MAARQSCSPVTGCHSSSHERKVFDHDDDDDDGDDDCYDVDDTGHEDRDGDNENNDDNNDDDDGGDDDFVDAKVCPIAAVHLHHNGEEFMTNSKRNYRL